MNCIRSARVLFVPVFFLVAAVHARARAFELALARDNNWLVIQGSHLPQNRAQLLFADSQKKARDLRVCD